MCIRVTPSIDQVTLDVASELGRAWLAALIAQGLDIHDIRAAMRGEINRARSIECCLREGL